MSNNFATDPKIATIRGLLKLAEAESKAGNQAAADTLNEKAAALIAKYGVDKALLAAEGEVEDPIVSEHVAIPDGYAVDLVGLIFNITGALGGQMVYLKRLRPGTRQSYTYTAHIFGHRSTLDRVIFLFDLLQSQMLFGAAAAEPPSYESARSYRKSWMTGFTAAIHDRLSRNEKKAAAESRPAAIKSNEHDAFDDDFGVETSVSMELVLVDRSKAVEDKFKAAYPKTKVTRRSLNGSGRTQGYAAGTRANIGNALGGGRKALVG